MATIPKILFKTDPQELGLLDLCKVAVMASVKPEIAQNPQEVDRLAHALLNLRRQENPTYTDEKLRKKLLKQLKFVQPSEGETFQQLETKMDPRASMETVLQNLRAGNPTDPALQRAAMSAYLQGQLQKPDFCLQCKSTAKNCVFVRNAILRHIVAALAK